MVYQVKTVGYRDRAMVRDMRKALRGMSLESPWPSLAALAGRVTAVGLCTVCLVLASMVTLAVALDPSGMEEAGSWVIYLLWGGFLLFLLLALVIRPLPDPIKDHLWPSEADVVTVTLREDQIEVEDGRLAIQVPYRMIRDVWETQACFYLFPMKRHFLMLRKRDFIEGDPDRFGSFLSDKMQRPDAALTEAEHLGRPVDAAPGGEKAWGTAVFQFSGSYTTQDLEVLNRAARKQFQPVNRWVLLPLIGLLGLVMTGGALMLLLEGSLPLSTYLFPLVTGPVLLILALLSDRLGAVFSRRLLAKGGEGLEVVLEEDSFTERAASGETTRPYEAVYGVVLCRERYFLFLNKRVAHILARHALVQGEWEQLGRFLKEKCGKPVIAVR